MRASFQAIAIHQVIS